MKEGFHLNPNINFKSPFIETLFGIGFHLFFSFAILMFALTFFTGAVDNFNAGFIIPALFNLGMLVLEFYFFYKLSKKFVSAYSDTIYYYRFKKIFLSTPITSTEELFIVTNGKYGNKDKIDNVFRDMVGDNKWIRGFEIDSDGKFIFPHDEPNETPQEFSATPSHTELPQNSSLSVSDEIANLSNLHAQGILTDEEFQKAKDRLINRI